MIGNYIIHLAILVSIYIILSVSLNLALGFTGLINLGHIAFFGIGAYTSALLTLKGVPFPIAFILAGLIASMSGFVLANITNKLKGDYLALATLGFSLVVYSIFINWGSVTNGPGGLAAIPRPNIFGLQIVSNTSYLVFALTICILAVLIISKIVRSRYGKLLEAVRDDAIGTEALGKNIYKLKYQSMMISAFFAGIAGSLFAHYISYINPASFYIHDIIVFLTIVIVGGLASIKGSVVAAIIIIVLPELLRFVNIPSYMIGTMQQILYAGILIAILMIRPRGIFGRIDLES